MLLYNYTSKEDVQNQAQSLMLHSCCGVGVGNGKWLTVDTTSEGLVGGGLLEDTVWSTLAWSWPEGRYPDMLPGMVVLQAMAW